MATQPSSSKSRTWIIILVVVFVGALFIVRSMVQAPSHEGQGTIIALNLEARQATVEAIDPANGRKRDYIGTVPPECPITINEKPAKFEDLRVGDFARVRVRSDRKADKINGKRPMIAEFIKVTRKEGATS